MLEWLGGNEQLVQQVGSYSLALLVLTIIALPVVVMKLPTDYFVSEKREPTWRAHQRPFFWVLLSLFKNFVGVLLILMGIAMLVLPGQGTLTILCGLAITNFPGKYSLERRIACQPAVRNTLRKIRELTGKPPLIMPMESPDQT